MAFQERSSLVSVVLTINVSITTSQGREGEGVRVLIRVGGEREGVDRRGW